MTCVNCTAEHYRALPIVVLPKEFAGTVIRITKSGVIKSVSPTQPLGVQTQSQPRAQRFEMHTSLRPKALVTPSISPAPTRTGETPGGHLPIHLRTVRRGLFLTQKPRKNGEGGGEVDG